MSLTKKKKQKGGEEDLELEEPVEPVAELEVAEIIEPDALEPEAEAELEPDVPEAVVEGPPKAPGRKSIGVKEVIPFAWKLVGRSDGMMLTLFKAVERDEVDAQFERLTAEGYYKDLQIHPIAPPPPKPPEMHGPHGPHGHRPPEAKEPPAKEAAKPKPETKSEKETKPAKETKAGKETKPTKDTKPAKPAPKPAKKAAAAPAPKKAAKPAKPADKAAQKKKPPKKG